MSKMRITRSYNYNALCDICGFKRKASELRLRWDGFMVCADTCWEPRHPLDFYRTRNDAHKLPWTRSDTATETTWTPTVTGASGGAYTLVASYSINDSNLVTYKITITPSTTTNVVLTASTFTLPTGHTVSTDKGGTAFINNVASNVYLGTVAAGATIGTPSGTLHNSNGLIDTLIISGAYIKA